MEGTDIDEGRTDLKKDLSLGDYIHVVKEGLQGAEKVQKRRGIF